MSRAVIDTATVTWDFSVGGQAKANARHDVVATASLPAPGAAMDGIIVIENINGGGVSFNLIVYAGGLLMRTAIGGT